MLGGVCAGIAAAYHIDVTVVRVAFVLITLATSGFGLLFYLAAWLVIPGPDQASMKARDVARANVDDVVATARQRASDLRRVNTDDLADGARRAAQDISRAASGVAQSARGALSRDSAPSSSRGTGSNGSGPAWTPPQAQPRAQHGGFKPRQGGPPGDRRSPPPGRGS
jgi:phage shock protein PspC (stress-responsive transcriptional regulator)